MKRVYYQPQGIRIFIGTTLMLIGLSPLMFDIYLAIEDETTLASFFSSFLPSNYFAYGIVDGIISLIVEILLFAIFLGMFVAGLMYVKKSKNMLKLEFGDNEIAYATLNIKTKGDVLATAFGYLQNYETIDYTEIDKIELLNNGSRKLIKLKLKKREFLLNIRFPESEAEEVRKFIMGKMK